MVNKRIIAQAIKDGKIVDKTTLATFLQNEELKQKLSEDAPALKKILEQIKGDKGDQGIQGIQGIQGKDGKDGKDGVDGRNGKNGRDGRDGQDGVDGLDGITPDTTLIAQEASKQAIEAVKPLIPKIQDIEQQIPQLGEEIRNALELLEGDERLDKSAIKGLEESLKKLDIKYTGSGAVGAEYKYTKYHGGASNLTVSTTAPPNPELNDLWYDIS